MRKSVATMLFLILACGCLIVTGSHAQQEKFDGLHMNMGNLFRVSNAKTRSIGPENFTGEAGKGGMATEGTGKNAARELGQKWKVSPSVRVPSKEVFTLAAIQALGWKSGGRYLPLQDDIASTAFWYQKEPHAAFPKLPTKDELEIN